MKHPHPRSWDICGERPAIWHGHMDGGATGACSKCAYNEPACEDCGQPLEYCDCDDYELEDVREFYPINNPQPE